MKRGSLVTGILAAAALVSCQGSKVKITGRFVGAEAKQVYIECVSGGKTTPVDSTRLDENGNYRFDLRNVSRTPVLYNISYNGESIPILIRRGDRLEVSSVGSIVRNYTVEGSEETQLLSSFNKAYIAGLERLNAISEAYMRPDLTPEESQRLKKSYYDEYMRIKHEQLKFIVENKASLAAVYALYQRLPGDRYLFNGTSDAIYFRTVADTLESIYPESPYLPALRAEIRRLDALQKLTDGVGVTGFPEIELSDIYGRKQRLSEVADGKTVLIEFWSPSAGNSNVLNAELKDTYRKYRDRGFEIYQIAVEPSKAAWVTAVQEQSLPWISVCDLKGGSSVVLRTYNVQRLPANYLLDASGTIVAKDLYGSELEARLEKLL